jgi:hypothetical protein
MYGSADHDHSDLSRSIDDLRYEAERKADDLRNEMRQMRRELYGYIDEGLAEVRNQGAL